MSGGDDRLPAGARNNPVEPYVRTCLRAGAYNYKAYCRKHGLDQETIGCPEGDPMCPSNHCGIAIQDFMDNTYLDAFDNPTSAPIRDFNEVTIGNWTYTQGSSAHAICNQAFRRDSRYRERCMNMMKDITSDIHKCLRVNFPAFDNGIGRYQRSYDEGIRLAIHLEQVERQIVEREEQEMESERRKYFQVNPIAAVCLETVTDERFEDYANLESSISPEIITVLITAVGRRFRESTDTMTPDAVDWDGLWGRLRRYGYGFIDQLEPPSNEDRNAAVRTINRFVRDLEDCVKSKLRPLTTNLLSPDNVWLA